MTQLSRNLNIWYSEANFKYVVDFHCLKILKQSVICYQTTVNRQVFKVCNQGILRAVFSPFRYSKTQCRWQSNCLYLNPPNVSCHAVVHTLTFYSGTVVQELQNLMVLCRAKRNSGVRNWEKLRYYKASYIMKLYTLQEEKFHWNLNFAILPMANLLNLNSAYIETFYKSFNDSSYKRKFKN